MNALKSAQQKKLILMPYPRKAKAISAFLQNDATILSHYYHVRLVRNQPFSLSYLRALFACQIIYIWFPSRGYLPLCIIAKLMGKKLICTIGGYEVANMPELNYGGARTISARLILRMILKLCDKLLVISQHSASEVQQLVGNTARFEIVHNLVNKLFYETQKSKKRRHRTNCVTVAQVNDSDGFIKGLDILLEIASALPEHQFTIIGETDKNSGIYGQLSSLKNIRFTGALRQNEIIDYFDEAYFYLQPSRIESFGVSILEAALRDCITLTSANGALTEFSPHKKGIVKQNDAHAYIRKIAELTQNSNKVKMTGLERFTPHLRQQKLAQIFKDL